MIEILDYLNVREKNTSLGLTQPEGIGFIPRGFATTNSLSEMVYENETPTIRSLLRQEGVPVSRLDRDKIHFKDEQSEAFLVPLLYIPFLLIEQNPVLLDVAIGVISNYCYEIISGSNRKNLVKMEYVVESKTGDNKKVVYTGPVEGMKEVEKIIKEVHNEN
jgi:hypothetical protein